METSPLLWARTELLRRLLEAYERSASFGVPGGWRRDVIVRLDRKAFPSAFAPEGREQLEALEAAALALANEGAAQVVRLKNSTHERPDQVRLSVQHLATAYALAARLGFEPLATGYARLASECEALAAEAGVAGWMVGFLSGAGEAARVLNSAPLGVSRESLKKALPELVIALRGAAFVSRGWEGAWERVVSERIYGDSKRLAPVRLRIADLLVRADPRWYGVPPDDVDQVLETYGVRRKPGLIRCAGAGRLEVLGRQYALEDFAPAAHLPESWAEAWVRGVAQGVRTVTTIENEYPFLSYVDERGGPSGLAADGEVAIYTAGFPTPALVSTLASLARRAPDASFRHWGDADVGGIRIWWLLRSRVQRPIAFFRTTAEWVAEQCSRGGRPLSGAERGALARLQAEIDCVGGDDAAMASGVIAALLGSGVKLEQERY